MPPPAKKQKVSHLRENTQPSRGKTETETLPNHRGLDDGRRAPQQDGSTFDTLELTLEDKPVHLNRYVPRLSSPRAPQSDRSILVFTHGAGGDPNDTPTRAFCSGYAQVGECISFKGGLNLSSRVRTFASVVAWAGGSGGEAKTQTQTQTQTKTKKARIAVGGRSMGARAAVMVAAEDDGLTEIVCVSYPLRGEKGELRDRILLDLPREKEVLFVSGSRDKMCDVRELDEVRRRMNARSWLVVVEGGTHGMELPKRLDGEGVDVAEKVRWETGRIAARWMRSRDDWAREKMMRWDSDVNEVKVVDGADYAGDGEDDHQNKKTKTTTRRKDGTRLNKQNEAVSPSQSTTNADTVAEPNTNTRQLRSRKVFIE